MIFVVLISVLVAVGVYLLLDDDPVRLIIGAGLLGHGAVLGLLTVMREGRPPLVGAGEGTFADPLPQALALTAIVISFGVTAFLLAFARSTVDDAPGRSAVEPVDGIDSASDPTRESAEMAASLSPEAAAGAGSRRHPEHGDEQASA